MFLFACLCIYIYIYIYINKYCHGVKNHTTRTVPINARRVDLLVLKKVRR